MRENKLRTLWAAGEAAVNGWLSIPDSYSAERMANVAFDSVTVDMQHGMVDLQAAITMLQAISTTDKVPMVRVPWNDPHYIMKSLDAGAYGVICPMINNRGEAEAFVGACRYAPDGYRSAGAPRGIIYGGADYYLKANETIVTLGMIETVEAMENLDAIMSTPGLDGIYVGPNDLSISLGDGPTGDPKTPAVLEAIDTIFAAAKRNGIVSGIHCASGEMARRYFAKGAQICTISSEANLMVAKAAEEVAAARGEN